MKLQTFCHKHVTDLWQDHSFFCTKKNWKKSDFHPLGEGEYLSKRIFPLLEFLNPSLNKEDKIRNVHFRNQIIDQIRCWRFRSRSEWARKIRKLHHNHLRMQEVSLCYFLRRIKVPWNLQNRGWRRFPSGCSWRFSALVSWVSRQRRALRKIEANC